MDSSTTPSVPGDRRSQAPAAPHGRAPRAPAWLCPEARKVWSLHAAELHAKGELSAGRIEALGVYCDLVVRLHRAIEMLDAGLLVSRSGGDLVTNPAWRIYRDAAS